MNKNIFTGLAISALALLSVSSTAVASNGAYVSDNLGCGMLDQYGQYIVADADHTVITHGAKGTIKCYTTTANDSGKAIRFSGFLCGLYDGSTTIYTNRSWEVIDSDGNATLTCQFK